MVTFRLYFPFWTQTQGAAQWFQAHGCKARFSENSRSMLVRGPRKAVVAGMELWQGSPVAPVDPTRGAPPPKPQAPSSPNGVNAPRQNQDPVFMPPMKMRGQTMSQRPKQTMDRGRGAKVSASDADVPQQDFKVSFASERRARHFGSALLRRVRGVKVSFDGNTVKVKHHPRHAGEVFSLAARSSKSPFMQRRGRDGSKTGGQGSLMFGYACATDPDRVPLDWEIPFRRPTDADAAERALHGAGADVSRVSKTTIFLRGVSTLQLHEYHRKGFIEGSSRTRTIDVSRGAPGQRSPYQPTPKKSPYARVPGRAREVFLRYAIHFASVAAASLAEQEMRKRGIDSATLDPDGTLIVGLRDVLARVMVAIARKFGGRVSQPQQTATPPTSTAPSHVPEPKRTTTRVTAPFTPPKPPPLPKHLRTKAKRPGYQVAKSVSFALDPIAVSYAVMDFLSSEDTRRIADFLASKGVRVVKRGANSIAARVRTVDLAGLSRMVKEAHGRLKRQRMQKETDAASMGIVDSLLELTGGRHRDKHGRSLTGGRRVRDTPENREITERHGADKIGGIGERARDDQGQFRAMGVTSALVGGVTRATIAVTKAALEGVMEAARQVGAKVMSKKQEVTVGGILRTVLVVEGTRQAIKDVRRAVQEDRQAASMAQNAAMERGVWPFRKSEENEVIEQHDPETGKVVARPTRGQARDEQHKSHVKWQKKQEGSKHLRTFRVGEQIHSHFTHPENGDYTLITHPHWLGGFNDWTEHKKGHTKFDESKHRRGKGGVWVKMSQAVSMALPGVLAGVTVAAVLRFAGMRIAEAVAFYLASKGIDAIAKGADVVVEGLPAEKLQEVENLARKKGGRLRAARKSQQQAASMGLRENLPALVVVAAGAAAFAGLQYLVSKGIKAVVKKGKLWVRRHDQGRAVSYLTEMQAPNASMDAESDYHEGYFRGKPMPQGGTRVQQVKDAQRRADELRARRARERAEYEREKEQLLRETTGRRDDFEVQRQHNEMVQRAHETPHRSNAGLIALGIWAPLLVPVLIGLGIKAYKTVKGWVAAPKDKKEAAAVEREVKKAKSRRKSASFSKYPWPKCVRDATKRYGSKERARRVCGAIKARRGASMATADRVRKRHAQWRFDSEEKASQFLKRMREIGAKGGFINPDNRGFRMHDVLVRDADDRAMNELRKLAHSLDGYATQYADAAFMFERALPQAMTQVL